MLTQHDYEVLADFRYGLRHFLDFSEMAAKEAGLTPRQHQALLAIKGFPGPRCMTVGELAERLAIHHNSAVELAGRLSGSGLIERISDASDRRRILLRLTEAAEAKLASLSAIHLEELHRLRPVLQRLLKTLR
jgi:DNA-binding MarR family transcriptional regulator